MNALQFSLLFCALLFIVLLIVDPRRPRWALWYLRITILVGATLLVLAPFAWLLAAAFKDSSVLNEYVFFPPPHQLSRETVNLENFERLFRGQPSTEGTVYFWQYLVNSLFLASATTVVQLFFSSLTGYALAKYEFRGKPVITLFVLGSMMIPGMVLVAPVYEMLFRLRLLDSYWGLIVPGAVSAYGVFLFRQAFLSIPEEMLDAGRVDGASEFRIYWSLVVPLVRPVSAAFCLVTFLGTWNAYLFPNILLQSRHKLTLPIVLNLYIEEFSNQMGVFLAGTLLAIVPPAILFFALQREFIGGLTSGSVKG
jgi:ABC-type glycerol-3-phosphate transport system permease component